METADMISRKLRSREHAVAGNLTEIHTRNYHLPSERF
jgi:hypothetical protein